MEGQFFVKIKIISWAVLEIAANMHSPFCPYLADFFVCVPPALQNCPRNDFRFHKKLTFHSCILILCGSCHLFTHYTLLPTGDRCVPNYTRAWWFFSGSDFTKTFLAKLESSAFPLPRPCFDQIVRESVKD